MPIQRYDINSCSEDCDPVALMKDGDYILYADHLAALAEKDKVAKTVEKMWLKRVTEYEAVIKGLKYKGLEICEIMKGQTRQIATLQERERTLIGRLQAHGDIETDKEEALRGGEATKNKKREPDEESEWT